MVSSISSNANTRCDQGSVSFQLKSLKSRTESVRILVDIFQGRRLLEVSFVMLDSHSNDPALALKDVLEKFIGASLK